MKRVLRAGLVGCGSLSQRGVLPHLSLPDAKEKIELVAVVDVDEERARQSAERYRVPAYYTDLETMLASTELDLVLIITPIPYHHSNAMAAMKAGKHVYIQKAMTNTVAEADELLAMRDRMGVKMAVAPGFELFPSTAMMRKVGGKSSKKKDPFDSETEAESFSRGDKVEARHRGRWLQGRVLKANRDGTYDIRFDGGDEEFGIGPSGEVEFQRVAGSCCGRVRARFSTSSRPTGWAATSSRLRTV